MTAALEIKRDGAEPELRVADVMHRGIAHCTSDASLREVAALLSSERVHCAVVMDDTSDGRFLWGVVSDRDLIAAATVRSLDEQTASGTAMKPATTIAPYESLARAAEQMTTHGVSHIVVVDPVKDRPLGVVSTLDLARALGAGWSPPPSRADAYFAAADSRGGADFARYPQAETPGRQEKEGP